MIEVLNFELEKLNTDNVLKYMGQRDCKPGEELALKIASYEKDFQKAVRPRVCFLERTFEKTGYESLDKHLEGCKRVIFMAATIGSEADVLRKKAAVSGPVNELIIDAMGTEGVEQICDRFCDMLTERYGEVTSRFSPGYGDYPLEEQKKVMELLQANKKIGVSLTDSLLMTPTKSVTAVVGIKE